MCHKAGRKFRINLPFLMLKPFPCLPHSILACPGRGVHTNAFHEGCWALASSSLQPSEQRAQPPLYGNVTANVAMYANALEAQWPSPLLRNLLLSCDIKPLPAISLLSLICALATLRKLLECMPGCLGIEHVLQAQ